MTQQTSSSQQEAAARTPDEPGAGGPRRTALLGAACLAAVAAIAFCVTRRGCVSRARPGRTAAVVTPEALARGITLSGGYLTRNVDEDGRFVYRRHVDPGKTYGAKYNVLRHAGSVYALSAYHRRTGEERTRAAIARAGQYLRNRFVDLIPARSDLLAAWTRPQELGHSDGGKPVQAKLGGTALALIALLSCQDSAPDLVGLEELQSLGRFLVFMQKDDGSFYSKYYLATGHNDEWVSLYYPGEAMLALLLLYDRDPDQLWLATAAKGMAYLARSRAEQAEPPSDHWALLATEVLLQRYGELASPPAPEEEIVDHAVRICERMLHEQASGDEPPDVCGSFLEDARTCPAAIRLEGLLAARRFLPDRHARLKHAIGEGCQAGIAFLLRSQIVTGELAGGFPRAARPKPDTPENRKFNRRVGEVRIDYVQHALSAMMAYEEMFPAAGAEGNR